MLARQQRPHPHTFVAYFDEVAVFEIRPADVFMQITNIADDDADVADGDFDHLHLLNMREPRIEVPLTAEQNLLLQTTTTTGTEKGLGVLEVVVPRHDGASDLALLDAGTVEHGDDTNLVRFDVQQA